MNPPKPSALKVLNGSAAHNPGRVNRLEPKPAPGVTDPPAWLPRTGPARAAWDRNLPVLLRMRVLTEADAEALALGCVALAEYLAAKRRGEKGWRRAADAWKRYQSTLRDFGMTPSARTRVQMVDAPAVDPLAAWEANL